MQTVYVNIPCPTLEEAKKLCKELLKKELCGTAKITDNVHLMWKEKEVDSDDVVLINLKTTDVNMEKIIEFIHKNHSWGNPCIEVLPVLNDLC